MVKRLLQLAIILILVEISARAEKIDGLVLENSSGLPLTSAEVRVRKSGARAILSELDSDSQGKFEVPDLSAGEYRVEVSKPNGIGATLRVLIEGDSKASRCIAARLLRGGAISARVTDQQGCGTGSLFSSNAATDRDRAFLFF